MIGFFSYISPDTIYFQKLKGNGLYQLERLVDVLWKPQAK